jgi:adenylate kinase family enzyme
MPSIVFVMGPTNAGKSTFLRFAEATAPSVRTVNVGAVLRAKYPPEHFAGQNNPKHTADEAWQICDESVRRHLADPACGLILVDGQPRDVPQVKLCLESWQDVSKLNRSFVLFDASVSQREARISQRFDPGDPRHDQSVALAQTRLTGDMVAYYTVLVSLLGFGVGVRVVNTNAPPETYQVPLLQSMLRDGAAGM